MNRNHLRAWLALALCAWLALPASLHAGDGARELSLGQSVYVPAYSHIYSGSVERAFYLAVTLSIRNIDPIRPITVTQVDYFETQGQLLKKQIDKPIILKPLESLRYVIPESDKSGGSGANFIVKWESDTAVNPPIIESIMIGTQGQQGISFTSRGVDIIGNQ